MPRLQPGPLGDHDDPKYLNGDNLNACDGIVDYLSK